MKLKVLILSFVSMLCMTGMTVDAGWENITRAGFEQAMNNVGTFFNQHTTYSVEVVHTSYKGWNAKNAFDKMRGYFKRDGDKYSSKILGIHTIQNKDMRVVIDSMNRTLIVTDPVKFKTSDIMNLQYNEAARFVTAYKERNTSVGKLYRVEFNDTLLRYAAYEVELTKNNEVRDIVIYLRDEYPEDMNYPNSPKVHPKVRIDFIDFDTKPAFSSDDFDVAEYVALVGKKLSITNPEYKDYRLIDNRFSQGKKKLQ